MAERTDGEASQAIQGGYADKTDTAVVGIVELSGNSLATCSGSLIAPNLVLTARHCVSNTLNTASGGGIICSQTTSGNIYSAGNFYVTTDERMDYDSEWIQAREVVGIPSDNTFCGQDQALIILTENVPDTVATPLVPRVDTPLVKDELYHAIGYGLTSDSQSASSGSRRRRDNLKVECAEEECQPTGQLTVNEWRGETGICSGDSGGPAIDLQSRVVGVTSRGSAGCNNPVYGSVHGWGDWIKQTAIYAAQLGGYEPAAWASGWPTDIGYNLPVGDSCDTGCPICLDDICTRLCDDTLAPCGDGYVCEVRDDGNQYCVLYVEPDEDSPKKKSKKDDADDDDDAESGGCSAGGREDPTNPVPWKTVGLALAIAGLVRRRR
ncbi:MAG: trypsin-like serine protease [Polyangiaceae bacterium]|nr:trypsin-like serine protease [Polyangiaceae bacterium]